MIVFPNCKINLGLTITRKRSDGYHDLETVFYPVAFTDVLEVVADEETENEDKTEIEDVAVINTGLPVGGVVHDNLCVKAYRLLKNAFPQLPAVTLYLHKAIPMGAGLGGGSADGAFTLKLLNQQYQLNLTTAQLIAYALQLGSDCPFFIINKPCYATGRGEMLEEVAVDLSGYSLLLVNPGLHINTRWAFEALYYTKNAYASKVHQRVKDIVMQPVATWKDTLVNDFEVPVYQKHPQLIQLKERLYHYGAVYAAMTGSGSTLFGIFEKKRLPGISFPPGYTVMVANAATLPQ